ncbi:hypothetical protein KH5H1_26450 [Corallococcus caeni]|uniref:Uncharacterized protein n=1 Tax=Corallococcus caeni TaxID=3082388 RepID=A0ABQ6QRP0_9BACT|nr:hypothetical protein KH5H1_26450 [Corallococcus sp. KH5-1]GMU06693.1 hypothetical protein ASNO1_29460 [Corallococcus sp. NO1]
MNQVAGTKTTPATKGGEAARKATEKPKKRRPDAILKGPAAQKPPAPRTPLIIPTTDVSAWGVNEALSLQVVSPLQARYSLENPGTAGVNVKLTLPDTVPGLPQHVVQHANVRGLSLYTPEFFKSLSSIERACRLGSSTARIEHVGESGKNVTASLRFQEWDLRTKRLGLSGFRTEPAASRERGWARARRRGSSNARGRVPAAGW